VIDDATERFVIARDALAAAEERCLASEMLREEIGAVVPRSGGFGQLDAAASTVEARSRPIKHRAGTQSGAPPNRRDAKLTENDLFVCIAKSDVSYINV